MYGTTMVKHATLGVELQISAYPPACKYGSQMSVLGNEHRLSTLAFSNMERPGMVRPRLMPRPSAAAGGIERLKHRVDLRGGRGMERPKHRVDLRP